MSASVTGERSAPLVQRLNGRRAVSRASSPASRMMASSGLRKSRVSLAGNGQALHAQRWCVGAVAECEVVSRGKCAEHIKQVASNGYFAHGKGAFAILDPEPRCTTAVVARHHVRAHADQIGDVKTVGDIRNKFLGAELTRLQMEIAGPGRSHRRAATLRVAGGNEAKLAGGRAVQ